MHQSVPVKELPNGRHIYQDCGGTFSHQHPTGVWWCERHQSIQEALDCYRKQESEATTEEN